MTTFDPTTFDITKMDITQQNVAVEKVLAAPTTPRHRYLDSAGRSIHPLSPFCDSLLPA